MNYPFGKAAFLLLQVAIVTGGLHLWFSLGRKAERPDLVMAIFAPNHEQAYRDVLGDFEEKHGVSVQLQLVSARALQSRLQSALLTGAPVPDLVELQAGSMGTFARGPLEDVGFVDLTDRLHREGLYPKMVESRYSLWSSRNRIFALPHDVHPVALCYRRDLIGELGIDVDSLTTWDDFVAMGRRITTDLDGDGNPDRYALDLPVSNNWALQALLLQQGQQLFNEQGEVVFDTETTAKTIGWYVRQTRGPQRIAYAAGWGQSLARAMNDGLVLFYFCPDWRSKQFQMDLPNMEGKLGLMPLPAWEEGGRRTSSWGGTGLAITNASDKKELAWKLAKFLYLNDGDLAERFRSTNIIPPLMSSWQTDAFDEPRDFYGGQAIGRLYADLAPQTPALYVSPYSGLAGNKIMEVYFDAVSRYEAEGEDGLEAAILRNLKEKADYVRKVRGRNVFLAGDGEASP
ncbi:MAG: extracellular solute-binding protein [Phycisphaeraceae bacterium]|nr:extracellular solute-binding protein [Phycisphaeraceae bacterium]